MKKILFYILFIYFIPNTFFTQQNSTNSNISDQGWYWDTALRGSWNFAGICYRNKIYYRKALHRDKESFLFKNSYLETGVELGLAPFVKTGVFVTWQPILPFKITTKVSYYKDLVGDILVDGADGQYNQGYLAFTGLKPNNVDPQYFKSQTLEIELSPVFTLGGKIGQRGALALIYAPIMYYYYSIDNSSPNQYRYKASESIILQKSDILWKHNFLFGYSILDLGLTLGVSGTMQYVHSIKEMFRGGIFGVLSYENSIPSKSHLIPYVRTQIGTWLKDRYLKYTFVIQAEFGLKYQF